MSKEIYLDEDQATKIMLEQTKVLNRRLIKAGIPPLNENQLDSSEDPTIEQRAHLLLAFMAGDVS